MFIRRKTHNAIVDALNDQIAMWRANYDKQFVEASKQRLLRDAYKADADALRPDAEKHRRSLGNLARANAARAAKAKQPA